MRLAFFNEDLRAAASLRSPSRDRTRGRVGAHMGKERPGVSSTHCRVANTHQVRVSHARVSDREPSLRPLLWICPLSPALARHLQSDPLFVPLGVPSSHCTHSLTKRRHLDPGGTCTIDEAAFAL